MSTNLPSDQQLTVHLPNFFPESKAFRAFRAVLAGANCYDLTRDYGFADGSAAVAFDRFVMSHAPDLEYAGENYGPSGQRAYLARILPEIEKWGGR